MMFGYELHVYTKTQILLRIIGLIFGVGSQSHFFTKSTSLSQTLTNTCFSAISHLYLLPRQ